ncbi:MAG TPA: glycosyltransferase family 2 protein [Firmicutes bacterium]|nr:glycosyltransferase family 2 protein [Candidatus Fermentithermobacillaceae bacterium]
MKVSICIPHYRQEEYLTRAVLSALEQVSPEDQVEVVVSDNASGRAANSVLDQLETLGPQVKVLRNNYNIGMVANFNRAVQSSAGEVICVLSADDELLPGAVRAACDEFRSDPELVMVYGYTEVHEDGSPPYTWPRYTGPRHRFDPPAFAFHNLENPDTPLVSAFFRQSAFDAVGGFKGEAGSVPDWLLWTELGLVGPVLRIDRCLGLYRVHGANETVSARKSFSWILSHYMAESYGRSLVSSALENSGTASTPASGISPAHPVRGNSAFQTHMTHARRSSLSTALNSLRKGQKGLGRRQLLLTYSLWPSFRAFAELMGVTALSFLPRSVIDRTYWWLKSRDARERTSHAQPEVIARGARGRVLHTGIKGESK